MALVASTRLAEFLDRALPASRPPRKTDRRAQFHHGLVEVARSARIKQFLARRPRLFARHPRLEHALKHALHIAINYSDGLIERYARDRSGRVSSYTGQQPEFFSRSRKSSGVFSGQHPSRRLEIARTPVIPKAAPLCKN